MAVSKLPLAPYRQDTKVFPTPIIGDVLFSELRDCTRIEIPEYGTPHHDSKKWPNHKLVYVKQVEADQREGLFEFYYAANREDQDLYNAAYGIRQIQGREFKSCTRTYVTPRADFDPSTPAFGSPMPENTAYVLYDKQQGKINEPVLDSLYVVEERNYVDAAFLDAPLSYTKVKPSLVPEKFQSSSPTTITEVLERGAISPPNLTGDEFRKTETQISDDLKKVETYERDDQDSNVVLTSERTYVEGTKAIVTETFDPNTVQQAEEGLLVVESQVDPLGDGSSVRTSVKVNAWPTLQGSEWNDEINGPIVTTQQFVAPTIGGPNDKNTTFRPVNKDRSLKIVEEVPTSYLNSYMLSIPVRADLDLPDVLESVSIVWSESLTEGDGDSTGNSEVTGAKSYRVDGDVTRSATTRLEIQPSLNVQVKRYWGRDLPATAKFFFLPINNGAVTEEQVLAKLGAQKWPVFKPRSNTLILKGIQLAVEVKAGVGQVLSENAQGELITSTNKSEVSQSTGQLNLNVVTLPFTINSTINLSGSTSQSKLVTARAKAKLTGKLDAESDLSESYTGTASVQPTSIPATSPTAVPTSGIYLIQSRIEPYKWGYAKCSAIVLNANVLA